MDACKHLCETSKVIKCLSIDYNAISQQCNMNDADSSIAAVRPHCGNYQFTEIVRGTIKFQ